MQVPLRRSLIGVALGAGAARGWAHLGALRALKRLGITPDVISGTSIGSVVGGLTAAGVLDQLEDWVRSLSMRRIIGYLDFRLQAGGVILGDKLMAEMSSILGNQTIEGLPVPFAAIATDLITGQEVWLREGSLVSAMRASMSLPGVFPAVRWNNRWLVDGGMTNPLPVSACRALGAHVVIAINVNGDDVMSRARGASGSVPRLADYDPLSILDESKAFAPESRMGKMVRRVFGPENPDQPSFMGTVGMSLNIVMERISRSRLAGDPPEVHVRPRLGHIGMFDFDRAEELIEEGESAVHRALPDIKDAFQIFDLPIRLP